MRLCDFTIGSICINLRVVCIITVDPKWHSPFLSYRVFYSFPTDDTTPITWWLPFQWDRPEDELAKLPGEGD